MKSRDLIRTELINIANRHGYQGEMVEIAANLLTYVLFSNQIEILNASQESSLSTAKLMNSKIKECMNVMYSVYRGHNARVLLNVLPNTLIAKSKYDLIYESNTFKLYANETYNINPVIEGTSSEVTTQVDCIFCAGTKYEYKVIVDTNNQYYIDVKDEQSGHLLSNLSEDVKVSISYDNGDTFIEYPITRNFYDHISTPIPEDPTTATELDKIFVLTTQDYGIRIYKRGHYKTDATDNVKSGYFQIDSIVKIECFKYTTLDDINEDEFKKIMIPGTELRSFEDQSFEGYKTGRKKVQEIDREDGNSILYNANSSSRAQSQILSSSDINHLFTEYFIDDIKSSNNRFDYKNGWYNPSLESDTLMIFYVPKITNHIIGSSQLSDFLKKYKSYFITHDIQAVSGQLINIDVSITVVITDHTEINSQIISVFSQYEDILTERSNYINEAFGQNSQLDVDTMYYKSLVDTKYIQAQISKISNVMYIDDFQYTKLTYVGTDNVVTDIVNNELPTSYLKPIVVSQGKTYSNVRIPVYYKFNPSIIYKNSYEVIS